MHATVRRLAELGAVRRTLAGHGHPARLEITERGRERLGSVRELAARMDRELLGGLTDGQRAAPTEAPATFGPQAR